MNNSNNANDFDSIKISIASPEQIRRWSYGEVKKPETINYRTFKPERDGLFCERIFGPVKDGRCACGKYKRIKYEGIICDRCGVEVTRSRVRRERLGHIELAAPVSHVWYFKGLSNRIGKLLGMSSRDLEKVLYFEEYVIISTNNPELKKRRFLTEEEYKEALERYGSDAFVAKMGAEAIRDLLASIDLEELYESLDKELRESTGLKRKKIVKRLEIVKAFLRSGNRPEWMIMDVIPVIPPDLRPLVLLDGGRFATSDLNDLYRRVINRNNRLKKMIELKAPSIIIRNEKRMLQEAVDVLFDNGRGRTVKGSGNRPLKSLSDMLKGKQGRFRQNLLGKRVDYSGRAVIVVGPELKLHQCGLPKEMALELFKPFILRKLEDRGHHTSRVAKKTLDDGGPEVFDALEEVIREHSVLLNRAPTLHRQGIQAFEPVLVEGKAIRIHPMVCAAFNADFDGDQMAVHVPLSMEAQIEAKLLMSSLYNILSPANGRPNAAPTQDIVLGLCYLTKEKSGEKGEGKIFSTDEEAIVAYNAGAVDLHARIKVKWVKRPSGRVKLNSIVEDGMDENDLGNVEKWKDYTTVGRVIFNTILPKELGYVNEELTRKHLSKIVTDCHRLLGNHRTVQLLDDLKRLGFEYATLGGVSVAMDDMRIPEAREGILRKAEREVKETDEAYRRGIITDGERYNKIIDIWTHAADDIEDAMFEELQKDDVQPYNPNSDVRFNSILMMANSGARGSRAQVRQLAGMRGLMAKPSGEIIESPIRSNFRDGLTVLEYSISTHGARKGLADTALKTADSGYLTRRLVDVAQEVIVSEEDCGTLDGITVGALKEGGDTIEPLSDRILGRIAAEDIFDPYTGELIVAANEEILEEHVERIERLGIEQVSIRSVLTCESRSGVCRRCYGRDLATGSLVSLGEAVGIIAAQSIGEPGTQLTMRTFHIGGTARMETQSVVKTKASGMAKFNELRTVRNRAGETVVISRNGELIVLSGTQQREVRQEAMRSTLEGKVTVSDVVSPMTGEKIVGAFEVITAEKASRIIEEGVESVRVYRELERHKVPYGAKIEHKIEEGEVIQSGTVFARWDPFNIPVITEYSGTVKFEDIIPNVTIREEFDEATGLVDRIMIDHKEEKRPRISIVDGGGNVLASYSLSTGAHIVVDDGSKVASGEVIAKIPRGRSKTKDITGGLPRVTELFEARKPKDYAILSELDGVVEFGDPLRGMRRIIVRDIKDPQNYKEYVIPHGKRINVMEGDHVQVGEALVDGLINPHDLLRIKGVRATQEYLVSEIQEVYRLQGVNINDKHIEIIVRQMLRKVRIREDGAGDTDFIEGELVDRFKFQAENERVSKLIKVISKGDTNLREGKLVDPETFEDENDRVRSSGGRKAEGRPAQQAKADIVLLGITKASLSTDSFISAASFQETTRVLTEAAIQGKVDELRGLKENVIMGRLIPAGTGMARYKNLKVEPEIKVEIPRVQPMVLQQQESAEMGSSG
ncbi:MAG: DNA-directed RNA polymerase subunit beta' [bacterium]